jgi:hypothetical protein
VSGIFISYRRQDSAPYAGRLSDRLCEVYGADKVFMDVDDIEPGVDFASLIEQKVASCDALIAVIGRSWLTPDSSGKSRLDDPHDFVRLELELALRRNILVVPVLVQGASMPPAGDLPRELVEFTQRQAVELSDRDFNRGFEKLRSALETVQILAGRNRQDQSGSPGVPARRGRNLLRNLVAALLLLGGLLGSYWLFRQSADRGRAVNGRWTAAVTYSWGGAHDERFDFEAQGARLLGTASFLGYKRGIENGTIEKDQITFNVRFDETSGGSRSTHFNTYTGRVGPDAIDFVVEDDRGSPPVKFKATRIEQRDSRQ